MTSQGADKGDTTTLDETLCEGWMPVAVVLLPEVAEYGRGVVAHRGARIVAASAADAPAACEQTVTEGHKERQHYERGLPATPPRGYQCKPWERLFDSATPGWSNP
jgi:hypothetical protein